MRTLPVNGILVSLLLCLGVPTALVGQDETPQSKQGPKGAGKGDKPGNPDGGEEEEKALDPNRPRSGLNKYGRLQASVRPRRLAPGQTGTATFYFAVSRRFIVLSDERVDLVQRLSNAGIDFGKPEMVAADYGDPGTPFVGRAVYDDIVKVTAPVTARPDAKYGKYPGSLLFRLPIADRATGRELGVYQGAVSLVVPVGDALPVIGEQAGDSGDAPGPERGSVRDPSATGGRSTDPGRARGSDPGVGAGGRDQVVATEVAGEDGLPLSPPVDDGDDSLLLIVAAVSLLGIGVVLLSRRSR